MRRYRSLYAILFAVHPVLALYASNTAAVRLQHVLPSLVVSVTGALLLLVACTLVLRDRVRAGLLTSLVLMGFFSFGHATGAWTAAGAPGSGRAAVAIVWGIIIATATFALVRTRRRLHRLETFATFVGVLLVAYAALQIFVSGSRAGREARAGASPEIVSRAVDEPPGGATPRPPRMLPDIYYIVLDGYARHDVMRDLYGFDNTPFLARLRARGFQISERSRANYCKTLHALAASLNMSYLHELMDVSSKSVDNAPLLRLVRSNRVTHLLRERGYDIVAFASGYELAEFSKIDLYLDGGGGWTEFTNVLLATTPVPALLGERGDPHARHRRRLEYILDEIPRIPRAPRPRFVFAHLLAPHPPFVFDREGNAVEVERGFGFYDGSDYYKHGGTREEYVTGYAEQARWVTARLERTLDALLERYGDAPPIVIVHSDHGPGSRLDWKSVPDTDLRERFGILMAAYLPGQPAVDLGETFSPVNVFRMVFGVYFGAELGPVVDRSYYTFQSQPFRYIDVTDPERPTELPQR